MRKLDSAERALGLDEVGDAAKGGDLCVRPEAGAVWGDAAIGRDAGRFGEDERGAFEGVVAQGGDVVVCEGADLGP